MADNETLGLFTEVVTTTYAQAPWVDLPRPDAVPHATAEGYVAYTIARIGELFGAVPGAHVAQWDWDGMTHLMRESLDLDDPELTRDVCKAVLGASVRWLLAKGTAEITPPLHDELPF